MILPLLFLNAVTAFVTLFTFKVALFALSVSGTATALRIFAKLGLCLGWDVLGAVMVSLLAGLLLLALPGSALATAGRAWQSGLHMVHGAFLLVSLMVSRVVGSPIDKTAIDLGLGAILPSLSWGLFLQLAPVMAGPLLFFWWMSRALMPPTKRAVVGICSGAVALFIASVFVVPGLANGRAAVHTFGLERSPLPLLVASYLRGPFRSLFSKDPQPQDPFCLDLRTPPEVGVEPKTENPLRTANPARTNLLLVVLESVSVRAMAGGVMPFVDQLGSSQGGARFLRHHTHWPQTMKSVFSLLCSELPHPDYPPITYVNPAIPCRSLPEVLKAAGYGTAFFHSGDLAYDRQILFLKHRGFDVMADRHSMKGAETAWHNGWGVDERVTVSATLEWIDQHKTRHHDVPFFAVFNVAAGHYPFEFPGHHAGEIRNAEKEATDQQQTLAYVDDRLRALVDGLAKRGLRDNTLVAIVSDHGPRTFRPTMERTLDASVYEAAVHVPFVLRGPQLSGTGTTVPVLTSHQDVAPTLLGLLGIAPPITMKGRNLLVNEAPRTVIIGTRPPLSQLGVLAGRWKLVHWQQTGASELYDLQTDPAEERDLATSQPGITNALRAQGLAWTIHARGLIENYAEILQTHGRRCD